MNQTKITVSHLRVYYRTVEALRDITLQVQAGKLTGIIGPNGAGKSTLLKGMLGLIPVTEGSIIYNDKPLSEQLKVIAYVPQRSQIDWTYPATVWDVVMMGRVVKTGWFRRFSTVSRQIGMEALARVGMDGYRDRPIGQLSGGQQQRVFLARSLAQEADIFVLMNLLLGLTRKRKILFLGFFMN